MKSELCRDRPRRRSADDGDDNSLILSVAAQLRRTGKEMTLRIERRDGFPARPNPSLIKLIVRAPLFEAKLLQSDGGKFAELARREKLNRPCPASAPLRQNG
jgi:hypothetical protein